MSATEFSCETYLSQQRRPKLNAPASEGEAREKSHRDNTQVAQVAQVAQIFGEGVRRSERKRGARRDVCSSGCGAYSADGALRPRSWQRRERAGAGRAASSFTRLVGFVYPPALSKSTA